MITNLPVGEDTLVSFNVSVSGTSQKPSLVSVCLEKDNTRLGFRAIESNNMYTAVIKDPSILFGVGDVDMTVQVVINNKVFTPLKTIASIQQTETVSVSMDAPPSLPPETVAQPEPVELPAIEVEPVSITPVTPSLPLIQNIELTVSEIPEAVSKKRKSLIQSVEGEQPKKKPTPIIKEQAKIEVNKPTTVKIKRLQTVTR